MSCLRHARRTFNTLEPFSALRWRLSICRSVLRCIRACGRLSSWASIIEVEAVFAGFPSQVIGLGDAGAQPGPDEGGEAESLILGVPATPEVDIHTVTEEIAAH